MNKPVKNLHRYLQVMKMRDEGKTFQQIADELKISRQRVWQIYSRASQRIVKTRNMGNHRQGNTRAA